MTPYYQDDAVTIYHGDCREVLPGLDASGVSLLVADPPYGKAENTRYASRGRQSNNDYPAIYGDEGPFDPRHLLRFPHLVLFGANHYASRLPDSGAWIVWDRLDGLWSEKREQGFNDTADAELAWTNMGGTVRTFRHRWNGYQRGGEQGLATHPTQKPVGLMRWIVDRWTGPGDCVLDPYMGAGPIAVACKELGRRYIGIEIEEHYCAVAAERCRQEVLAL